MHELGIVFEIVKRVELAAMENLLELPDIAAVVVEVGEASTIVPKYLKECWPAAIDGTDMEDAKLEVEIIVASVQCKTCGRGYEYLNSGKVCPECGSPECVMVTGQELNIKEIQVFESEEEEV
ncbi:hydrogenase maturation nickel metallochaperone HypA [uncultured Robinsoniella sp.]|uniref:hydrogenase maturation nickel metallochaperone HypA n=1 Tax=uncultured Robinsoniella sp. TaxID=904190 RepID=UPI00374EA400